MSISIFVLEVNNISPSHIKVKSTQLHYTIKTMNNDNNDDNNDNNNIINNDEL